MGIEGTVALASLAGAITAILIATKIIAGPASLALIASPAGIAVLFIAAVYFAAAAYTSYQQMNATKGEKGEKGDKGEELSNEALKERVGGFMPDILQDPAITALFDNKYVAKG